MRLRAFLPLISCIFAFHLTTSARAQTPLINEFMASNATIIMDDDGDYSDWIELYNPGDTAYDLTGCYVSDDAGNPLRWRFPGGSIPANGFLLIWASNKDRQSETGELHTNFAISADGEELLLTAPDGRTRLDEAPSVALIADVSYGRLLDGADEWVVFGTSTPGTTNEAGQQHLAAPVFSVEPGFFADAVTLEISASDSEALITYTLDGSEPTELSTPCEAPILLESRLGDPNVISLIPTNYVEDHFYLYWKPPRGEVFKINVVRARAFRSGYAPSSVTTGSYIIDPDIATRLPLPVISLATSNENFFADDIGIYVPGDTYVQGDIRSGNYFQSGDEWERPVHIEFFDLQGSRLLAQDAGARIHGELTRYYPQKTLRLYARSEYGPSHFDCALFPDRPYDSYDRFLIRNSGQDWAQTGFKDLAMQTMCANMGFDTQAGRPVIHFINGEYWGLANLRERYDDKYIVRCYAVAEDDVVLLENDATVEEGLPSDRNDYLALRAYVTENDMADPASLAYVAERMDLDNYIAYNVAEIYAANYDWPGNNIRFWRNRIPEYDPDAPYGHDGRWRWMMFDVDYTKSSDHNTLAHATAVDGPSWPNPPWSTALFRGLLENPDFKTRIINEFADRLNSTFRPNRLIGIIDGFADIYEPAIAEWQDRWDVTYYWPLGVQSLRNFAIERPNYLRKHIINCFGLAGTVSVTVAVNDPERGRVQVSQLLIDPDLPGIADPLNPYPWTGIYFQGVPITITAVPTAGYRFVAWQETGSNNPSLILTPDAEPFTMTAVFAPDNNGPVAVHFWHFNGLPSGTLSEVAADASMLGGAMITYAGTGTGYMDRVSPGTDLGAQPDIPAGYALRVRNPSDTRELILTVPSTGFEDLSLRYAVTRSSNGATEHSIYYRVENEGSWQLIAADVTVTEQYELLTGDMSGLSNVNDNPNLVIKFVFGGENASGTSGNQRFDNITLIGKAIAGTNLSPQVVQEVELQKLIEAGEEATLDLADVFSDPENDFLVYTPTSSDAGTAETSLSGTVLTVTPLQRGEARITVLATDGYHDPVEQEFRVLIYPQAANTIWTSFAFTAWDPDLPERTYPKHMLFLQSDANDPGLTEPLLHPYYIEHDDYHEDDAGTIGYPYNNTGFTRINGLGDDGISFINTGRGRDLGGALLAIDTRFLGSVEISWLAGTILPDSCIYAIRLQYRVGLEGEFSDLLSGGRPVEYLRSETAGDVQIFGPVALPAELRGHPYLQLLWRYYHVDGTSEERPQLRLDDIHVTSTGVTDADIPGLPTCTELYQNAPNPFNPSTTIRFDLRATGHVRLNVYNIRGERIAILIDRQMEAGRREVVWDGRDSMGRPVASGVYFCRLSAGDFVETKKMILLK